MKFYQFEEITYPGLDPHMGPEDRITNRLCDPQIVVQHYREHLELLVNCEALGYDGVFLNEHHFTASNNAPDSNVLASALLARTQKLRVGIVGNVISLRHPIAVAEAFAMLDCLSNGRFMPGVVRGLPAEWVSYNMDPFTSRKRFTEAFEIIQKCLTEELVDYEGEFWNIAKASIWPKPVQNPFPSFWMPAGSIESIRFAAKHRMVACQTLQPTFVFQQCFDEYRRIAREEFDWDPGVDKFGGLRFMHIDEDQEKAEEEGVALFKYLMLSIGRPVVNSAPLPGFNTDQSYSHRQANPDDVFGATFGDTTGAVREVRDGEGDEKAAHRLSIAQEAARFRDGGVMLAGTPEFVAEWLAEDARTAGYGNLMMSFRVGNATHAQSMNSQRLFAERVMPLLNGINVVDESVSTRPRSTGSGTEKRKPEGYFTNSNYVLSPEASEMLGVTKREVDGSTVASWILQIGELAEDGSPTQLIVPGPSNDHLGCALLLNVVDSSGNDISDSAEVIFETAAPDGSDRQVMFKGSYGDFKRSPDGIVPAQQRGVALNGYMLRMAVAVPEGDAEPDLEAEQSTFSVRCFKHLMTVSA